LEKLIELTKKEKALFLQIENINYFEENKNFKIDNKNFKK
jgi:hypothetical protein